MRVKLGISLLLMSTFGAVAEPRFERLNPEGALTHKYTGGWEYFVGGGVATLDCNGDFFPELYVAGGTSPATLFRNQTSPGGSEIQLRPETPKSLAMTGVTGAYPLDINSDGILDLFIMRVGQNYLMKGGPDCTFEPFSDLGFTSAENWTTAFSATWETGNALPTLAIGNYVDRRDTEGPFEACDSNYLMRAKDRQYSSQPLQPGHCALSMLFSDWGRQGRQDLRVSNDRHYYVRDGQEQLWAMDELPRMYSTEDGWNEYKIWGMGIASRDITGDGFPEILLTSMGDQKLQTLEPTHSEPNYSNSAYDQGISAHRPYIGDDGRPSTGWHAEFADVNNDGLDDIFIAKGNVDQMPGSAMADPNNLLVQSPDGTFSESGEQSGIASFERSRGAALVDLNLDGLIDIVVVNRRAPFEVYQNITNRNGNWVLLDVGQAGTNRQAVGTWLEVRAGNKTWHREITVGGGHASGNAALIHFGLGEADFVELRMTWPDGNMTDWSEISVNQIWRIQRRDTGVIITPVAQ